MKWQFLISIKYLLEKRRERFISATAIISILGIAVGVAALIVTMGVMNGFNKEIEDKILSVYPHIIIGGAGRMIDAEKTMDAVMAIDGVSDSAEFLDGQAIINIRGKIAGALLRGVHQDPRKRLIKVENYLSLGSPGLKDNGALIGSELARNFSLGIGDRFSIISPATTESKEFKVNGVFKSGRYDYDLNYIFVNIDEARALLGEDNVVNAIGLKIAKVFETDDIRSKVYSVISPALMVTTWKEVDKNLFSALKLEKMVMFLLVTLIILVACFNIVSTLIMTVMEKTRDIGILKAIGANRLGIMSVFFLEGLYISVLGISLGAAMGLGLCYLQAKYEIVKLPPDVYYIYSVPVNVSAPDTFFIIAAAFVLGMAAAIYPSLHASKLQPIDVLRCE
ncbi:MAG: ABC transporter permease [Candidatus Omnitrophota bacterium]